MIRCLLFQASLPATYWAEALHTATHLLNRLPSKAVSHLHLTSPCTAQPLPTTTCACSAVPATLTFPLPPLTSFLLAPLAASSSATPQTTRGIGAWTSPPTASSSLVTSCSTKMCFPLQAPPHPPILTPSSSPTRFPPHPRRPVLRRYRLLVQPRRHSSRPSPRHARPRRSCLRHARPRRSCLRHARPCRPRLRHARPRRPRLRHARPRRPRLRHTRPR
jgi:hypothetical protein